MTVSVVLPVFKQAQHVRQVLHAYLDALTHAGLAHEIVAVVNGGDRDTHRACVDVAATEPSVRVLFTDRAGWGHSVRIGLSAATGDFLCYTNSARTSAAALVSVVTEGVAHQSTVLMAMRLVREGWWRRAGSLLYNLECRALFGLPVWDINGTPKVFPRQFHRLLALTRDDDLIDLEFHIVCQRESYPVLQVPVLSGRRHGGRSTTNWRSAVHLYYGAYAMWRESRSSDD